MKRDRLKAAKTYPTALAVDPSGKLMPDIVNTVFFDGVCLPAEGLG